MKFDITQHELVPAHEALSEKDAKEFLKKFNITKGQLPKILLSDPAVKKIEAKAGDIIKITRNSRTGGKSYFYRVVVTE